MRKIILLILLILPFAKVAAQDNCRTLYNEMGLAGELNYEAFENACHGYTQIEHQNPMMTVIDFSKPSTKERLYIIDMVRRVVVMRSHVAHGQGSGENYATSFGNDNGSHKSSLGFFLTGETYYGQNGYSMRLHGLESGINDKAYERAVVVHGAAYANPATCTANGRLGRSWGCPALPESLNREAIDLIKEGSVLFIYAEDGNYPAQSKFV